MDADCKETTPEWENAEAVAATVVLTAQADAMDTRLVRVECGFTRGFAGMQLIGNATEVCRDGKERARAALERLNIHIPPRRLVVSLTPADLKKDGSQLDLPIAVSLALLLRGQGGDGLRGVHDRAHGMVFCAELSLAGELRPVKCISSFAVAAVAGNATGLVVAPENLVEAEVLLSRMPRRESMPRLLAFNDLAAVLEWLFEGRGPAQNLRAPSDHTLVAAAAGSDNTPDFDDMQLTPQLSLAAMVVATGPHSILLRGSPGTGKSMFAVRLPSILPDLQAVDHIESMRIYSSYAQSLPAALLAARPPFRAPHHHASAAAILGSDEAPGEIALAHGGVLFLDELPEFRRDVLESLREPLETGEVRVARSRRKLTWRARVILVAACNNCPCGYSGSKRRTCRCHEGRLTAYRQRLSGPVLDRIDVHLNMPEPDATTAEMFVDLGGPREHLITTLDMRARVLMARQRALQRNAALGVIFNRDLPATALLTASALTAEDFTGLVNSVIPPSASRRAMLRCLRVARTLADLDDVDAIGASHLLQAWAWQAEPAAIDRGEDIATIARSPSGKQKPQSY